MRSFIYLKRLVICLLLIHTGFQANAQPTANFTTVGPTTGCGFISVDFVDISTGSPTSWFWKFNNGNTSVLQNPHMAFTSAGTYDIMLVVSDGSSVDTLIMPDFITVLELPAPQFTADITRGCVPLTVNFTDLSVSNSSYIVTHTWDFGDGNTGNIQNPTHTYQTPGIYTVTLHVEDFQGCSESEMKMAYIEVIPTPNLSFVGNPQQACAPPHNVAFTNFSSGNSNLLYLWQFGDNGTASNPNPQHTYTQNGQFDVTLIAQDQDGCRDTLTQHDYIFIDQLEANFGANQTVGCGQISSTFIDSSTGPIVSWTWDFGDNTFSSSSAPNPHLYNTVGTYDISLVVSDGQSCTDTFLIPDFVEVLPIPEVSFTSLDTAACQPPFQVQFQNTSQFATSWLWDFGDGDTSTQENPVHTYSSYGNFTVSLTGSTIAGCPITETIVDYITISPPSADFVVSPGAGCAPLEVNFQDQTASYDSIVEWYWWFSDNTTDSVQHPVHIFQNPGEYDVVLVVTTHNGCSDTIFKYQEILVGTEPISNFYANDTIVCLSEAVEFFDLSQNANQWAWEFGDGGFSSNQNPVYQFTDTGYFSVSLTAMFNGCPDTLAVDNYVYIAPPKADFAVEYDCANPYSLTFTDMSLAPHTWLWEFGDGSTSTNQNPTHVYNYTGEDSVYLTVTHNGTGCQDQYGLPIIITDVAADFEVSPTSGCHPLEVQMTDTSIDASSWEWLAGSVTSTQQDPLLTLTEPGVYDVFLKVTDVHGCQDSITKPGIVTVYGPVANFGGSPQSGCSPLTVQFYDSSYTLTGNVTAWLWDFGDGDSSTVQNPIHTYASTGYQTVTLTVWDDQGCHDTESKVNFIYPTFPIASFWSDSASCSMAPVIFNANASSGSYLNYYWDFGDSNTSTVQNPVHQYANPGVYTVSLTVTDINGCDSTLVKSNHITVSDPVATFTADTTFSPCPPLLVNFESLTNQDVAFWHWDFGDGITSTDSMPSHLYVSPGDYDVTLVVTSPYGCKDTMVISNFTVILGPNGTFTYSPAQGCIDHTVDFMATTVNTASSQWFYGDGFTTQGTDTVQHTYLTAGTYYPVLVLDDGLGCQYAVTSPDSIQIGELNPDFEMDTTYLCHNGTVQFSNLTYSTPSANSYTWNFGDGTYSTDPNPSHYYSSTGLFNVTLTVENDFCMDSTIQQSIIHVDPGPTAEFFPSLGFGCVPLTVAFNEAVVSDSIISAYLWDFGDSNTSTLQNPQHVYTNAGTYTATLIVWSNTGCSDTIAKQIVVHPLPVVSAGMDDTICAGDPTMLQATGGMYFSWSPGASLSDSTVSNPIATPDSTTTYVVEVTDGNNCINYSSVTVVVNQLPILTVTPDQEICLNDTVSLSASGAPYFSWSPANGLSGINVPNPQAFPTATTTYLITGTDHNQCSKTEAITVTVHPLPPADAGPDVPICFGFSTPLQATGGLTYEWSPTTGLDSINISNPVAGPLTTQTYSVLVTDTNTCQATDSVTVTVNLNPIASTSGDTSICLNDVIQISASGAVAYNWQPSTGLNHNNVASPMASPDTTTQYTVIITDNFGCRDTAQLGIEVFTLPTADAGPDVEICQNDSIQLNATGGIQFDWWPHTGLSCDDCPNPIAFPQQTTAYLMGVTDQNGCIDIDTIVVTVHELPTGILNENTTICQEEQVQLFAQGGVSYQWSPATGLNCTNCAGPIATPMDTTTYTVIITNQHGCVLEDQVTITVNPLPIVSVSSDTSICLGDEATLTASGGDYYTWSPITGLDCPSCAQTLANPVTNTTYTVEISTAAGCSRTDEVSVAVTSLPVMTAGPDLTICLGDAVGLQAESPDAISFSWSPTLTLSDSLALNPFANPEETTTYTLMAQNQRRCTSVDSVTVSVITEVEIDVEPNMDICLGELATLGAEVVSTGNLGTNFLWTPYYLLTSHNSQQTVATLEESQEFRVIASSGSCVNDTQTIFVTVNPLPEVDAGPDVTAVNGEKVQLQSGNETAQHYNWHPPFDLNCWDCPNPVLTADETTTFTVTVTDSNGCISQDEITVHVVNLCGEELFIANAFTPNGDDFNDRVYVRNLTLTQIETFRIFNRWGELLFETDDMSEGWDGRKRGKLQDPGVYVWYLKAICTNGQVVERKGNVTLIR